jgi:hypothetical protein
MESWPVSCWSVWVDGLGLLIFSLFQTPHLETITCIPVIKLNLLNLFFKIAQGRPTLLKFIIFEKCLQERKWRDDSKSRAMGGVSIGKK